MNLLNVYNNAHLHIPPYAYVPGCFSNSRQILDIAVEMTENKNPEAYFINTVNLIFVFCFLSFTTSLKFTSHYKEM